MINNNLSTQLPKDEIGFICMHIRGAIKQEDGDTALAYTKSNRDYGIISSVTIRLGTSLKTTCVSCP